MRRAVRPYCTLANVGFKAGEGAMSVVARIRLLHHRGTQ